LSRPDLELEADNVRRRVLRDFARPVKARLGVPGLPRANFVAPDLPALAGQWVANAMELGATALKSISFNLR
jgi:hypothetical protein